ncbi:Fatty acid desaturase [Posidoniimonas polymericola]|uniref:Fatty acid desaturase n=1 Tax=Posidoniimonas polymericola TaxID=2528002 RepID=A0A5C5Y226_9BACT|nr:fatty acid desaturase [Posidoniimonas polymericola]TWT67602.1 Fatty acid desaturase [Posidoniimonas polymericola]
MAANTTLERSEVDEPDAELLGAGEVAGLRPLARPPGVTGKIFWPYAIAFLFVHGMALLAFMPRFFSWSGVTLAVLGYYWIGAIGINLGYHRMLTHRGFITPKWLEHTIAILGVCNLQDGPARWVAIHRMHHQFSDEQRDPHSPLVDFLWGHLNWLVYQNSYLASADFYDRYARDLLKDRFYMKLEKNLMWFWVYVIHGALFYGVGLAVGWAYTGGFSGGVQLGMSWLVWGVFVRTVAVWHVTWAVNSVTHLWGYRNYETKDQSKNSWWVALLTSGEGWHNNHHATPRCVSHGHRWWEIDATYWVVLVMERLGLAKEVVHPKRYDPSQAGR